MNNFWGESDDEPLPDWMDPIKCRQLNERKRTSKDLMSTIQECLEKPEVPIVIVPPTE